MAAAKPSISFGGTVYPLTSCSTISCMPPPFATIAGLYEAAASAAIRPKLSCSQGELGHRGLASRQVYFLDSRPK